MPSQAKPCEPDELESEPESGKEPDEADFSYLSCPQHSPDWDDAAIDASFATWNDPPSLPSSHVELPELDGIPDTLITAAPHLPTISAPSIPKTSSSSSLETPSSSQKG